MKTLLLILLILASCSKKEETKQRQYCDDSIQGNATIHFDDTNIGKIQNGRIVSGKMYYYDVIISYKTCDNISFVTPYKVEKEHYIVKLKVNGEEKEYKTPIVNPNIYL